MSSQENNFQSSAQAPISNAYLAARLTELGDLVELTGGGDFRARAYHNAAREIGQMSKDVAGMILHGQQITGLPGIGESIAGKIEELSKTGHCKALDQMRRKVPPGLLELLKIGGLGPHRVRELNAKLGIKTRADLLAAAQSGKIRKLRGFGPVLEKKLLEAAASEPVAKLFSVASVEEQANELLEFVRAIKGVNRAIIAGSYRRCKEAIGDLDLLADAKNTREVIESFLQYKNIGTKLEAGGTKASVVLVSGLQVDLRVVPDESFGAAMHYFTGSKAHNIAVRDRALRSGLLLNEYGLFRDSKRVAGKTEESIFRVLKLDFIPPELRENLGEIEAAAAHTLPELITVSDIRGELHCHTFDADGRHTIEQMAQAAKDLGLSYIAITDHSPLASTNNGLSIERLENQIKEIDRLNERMSGITILKSAEVEILRDGTLDLPDEILKQLDLVVCAINSFFHLERAEQTKRILKAMDNPYCNIVAHPNGRLSLRQNYDIDLMAVASKASKSGVMLQINGDPNRLDLNGSECRLAKDEGVRLVVSSDAHSTQDLANLRFAVEQARRGWIEADNVANTYSLQKLRKLSRRAIY